MFRGPFEVSEAVSHCQIMLTRLPEMVDDSFRFSDDHTAGSQSHSHHLSP